MLVCTSYSSVSCAANSIGDSAKYRSPSSRIWQSIRTIKTSTCSTFPTNTSKCSIPQAQCFRGRATCRRTCQSAFSLDFRRSVCPISAKSEPRSFRSKQERMRGCSWQQPRHAKWTSRSRRCGVLPLCCYPPVFS